MRRGVFSCMQSADPSHRAFIWTRQKSLLFFFFDRLIAPYNELLLKDALSLLLTAIVYTSVEFKILSKYPLQHFFSQEYWGFVVPVNSTVYI